MADRCPRFCRRDGGAARIGEQIQNTDRASRALDQGATEIPVRRLLGKETRMLESHRFDAEGQVTIGDVPRLGETVLVPRAATRMTAGITCVGMTPERVFLFAFPNDLRVGTYEAVFPPQFEFFTVRGIDDGIILPLIADPHDGLSELS